MVQHLWEVWTVPGSLTKYDLYCIYCGKPWPSGQDIATLLLPSNECPWRPRYVQPATSSPQAAGQLVPGQIQWMDSGQLPPPNAKPKRLCQCGAWAQGVLDYQDGHAHYCAARRRST